MDVKTAEAMAARELSMLPGRLGHVRAVGELAESVGSILGHEDHQVLVMAAYLHDIGYAPRLARTGFHPLDGAEWLAAMGERRLANLVAHHTGSVYEARNRGLADEHSHFEQEVSLVADLLSWCDLSRGPQGQSVTPEERLREVAERYGSDHVVARSLAQARTELLAACLRVDALLPQVK